MPNKKLFGFQVSRLVQTHRVGHAILILNTQQPQKCIPTVQNIVFDSKNSFFAINHRLKIKNAVADQKQVLPMLSLLSHARCDMTTSPVFVFEKLEHCAKLSKCMMRNSIEY